MRRRFNPRRHGAISTSICVCVCVCVCVYVYTYMCTHTHTQVLVVDCPTLAHAAALRRRKVFWDLVTQGKGLGPLTVVHMSPREVLEGDDYQAWSQPFPPSTAPVPETPNLAGVAAPAAQQGGAETKEKKDKKQGGAEAKEKKGKTAGGAAGEQAPVAHIVSACDQGAVDRPLFVASERYLALLHALDVEIFPRSAGAYAALVDDVSTPAPLQVAPRIAPGAPVGLGAMAGWPMQTFVMPPHRVIGLRSGVADTASLHFYCKSQNRCACTAAGRAAILALLPPPHRPAGNGHHQDGLEPRASDAANSHGNGTPPPPALALEEVVFLGVSRCFSAWGGLCMH